MVTMLGLVITLNSDINNKIVEVSRYHVTHAAADVMYWLCET